MKYPPTVQRYAVAQKSRCGLEPRKKRPRLSSCWEKTGIDDHGIAGAKKPGRKRKSDGQTRRGHSAIEESLVKARRSVFRDRRNCTGGNASVEHSKQPLHITPNCACH